MKKSYFFLSCALAVTASLSLQAKDNALLAPGARLYSYAFEGGAEQAQAAPTSETGVGEDRGVNVFGATFYDATSKTWFVNTNVNDLFNIDRVARIDANDDYGIVRVLSGEMVGDSYYAHIMRVFSFSVQYGGWAKVDPKTGAWTYLWDAKKNNNGYDVDYIWDENNKFNAYQILDLAYNPVDGKLYGIATNEDASLLDTVLGTVNLEDGFLTPIAHTNGYVFGITFGNDGTLYAALRVGTQDADVYEETESCDIVKLDLNNIENGYIQEDTMLSLKDEDGIFRAYGIGTLTTDRATGLMYFYMNGLRADNTTRTQSSVFSINPRTNEQQYLGRLGYNDMLVGATVTGSHQATSLKAPGVVTVLKSDFDTTGADNVTLTWGLPESNWDLSDLTDITEMKVAVDNIDNVIATVPASLDTKEYSYTAKGVGQGAHTFYVWGVNAAGEGPASETNIWAGHDVPGTPVLAEGHISAVDDNTITFSWSTPVEGKNGGWFDAANVKYNITRLPDNKVVAEGLDALTFTDNTINETRAYSYVITPVTADGEGVSVETDAVIVGNGVTIPFEADLTVTDEARRFKAFDGNSGYEYDENSGIYNYRGLWRDMERYPVDDYFVTPDLMTTKGKVYRVEFDVYFHFGKVDDYHSKTKHDFEIVVGHGDTKEALTEVIYREDDHVNPYYYMTITVKGWFTADSDEPYNAAFHMCTDDADNDMVAVSGCRVYEMKDVDLEAVAIEGSKGLAIDVASPYQVTVYNAGNKDIDNAIVSVVSTYKGLERTFGAAKLDHIASHETKVVDVMVTPEDEGTLDLAARVSVDGDENPDNDISGTMTVEIGKLAYDLKVDGEFPYVNAETPFGFLKKYYASQTIYTVGEGKDFEIKPVKDEFGEEHAPMLYGIAYEYSSQKDQETGFIKGFDVEVYVSQEAKLNSFRSVQRNAVIVNEQTRVFAGQLDMEDGTNNLLRIEFTDPFQLEYDKNLIITVIKTGGASATEFPYAFNVFNENWEGAINRSISYKVNDKPYPLDERPQKGDMPNYCNVVPYAPVVYLAMEKDKYSGVENVFVGNNGKIDLGNLAGADVTVFDITGKTVYRGAVNGSIYNLPLANGLYVVRVADANGVRNAKISIRR